MKSPQKRLACFVLILFVFGCATTIKTVITSDPPGALIYSGDTADNMSYEGTTPMTLKFHDEKPYWKKWYYQIRKPGYEDSEIMTKPQGAIGVDRYVHAKLKPLSESETSVEDAVESEPEKYIKKVFVKDKNNIYSKKSFEGKLVKKVETGTLLTVIQKDGDWNKIKTEDEKIGWIHNKAIVEDKAILIKDLEDKVKVIPAHNNKENLEIYEKLLKLDPSNKKYKEKVEYYSLKIEKAGEKKVAGAKEKIKPPKSETKLDDEKLKSVVYVNIPGYFIPDPYRPRKRLFYLHKGEKLTVLDKKELTALDKKEIWIKVKSERVGTGWLPVERVVADASGFEKSGTEIEGENSKCTEIRNLSAELMTLMANLNFDKHNEISLKLLRLMEELRTTGSDKQIQDCNTPVHLSFSRKATVSYSGKGMIDREDARIKYKMTAKMPAILQVGFTVIPSSTTIMSYGFLIMSDVSCPSTHVEFKGVLRDFDGYNREKWVNATQFEWDKCPKVTMSGGKPYPFSYSALVDPPRVTFYSNKKPLPSWPLAYPLDYHWPRIRLSEQDLQKAFETGRLVLKRKTESKSVSGTVIIDFAPTDPELQAIGQSNPGGIGLWGDRTTHGGFLLATEKGVFIDGHPVAKEGDPVLCPIHGLSKVSRDESSGVYIGDKTVAVSGGKADCGAQILSGDSLILLQSAKQ